MALFLASFLLLLLLSSPVVLGSSQLEQSLFGFGGGRGGPPDDGASCDAIVQSVTDSCRDYVSGTDPPQPFFNNPCCKALRTPDFGCLCGRIKFRELNQRALLSVIVICNVKQRCNG